MKEKKIFINKRKLKNFELLKSEKIVTESVSKLISNILIFFSGVTYQFNFNVLFDVTNRSKN